MDTSDETIPELTPGQRLELLEHDLEADMDTCKKMLDAGKEQIAILEQNLVRATDRYSAFMLLKTESVRLTAPTEELDDFKQETDGGPSTEPTR